MENKLRKELRYGSFKNILSIKNMHFRSKVNALAETKTIKEASVKLKISSRSIMDFMKNNKITQEELNLMRKNYKEIQLQNY